MKTYKKGGESPLNHIPESYDNVAKLLTVYYKNDPLFKKMYAGKYFRLVNMVKRYRITPKMINTLRDSGSTFSEVLKFFRSHTFSATSQKDFDNLFIGGFWR